MKYNHDLNEKLKNLDDDIKWSHQRQHRIRQRLINEMNGQKNTSASWMKRRFIPVFSALLVITIITTLALSEFTGQDIAESGNTTDDGGDNQSHMVPDDGQKNDPVDGSNHSSEQDNQNPDKGADGSDERGVEYDESQNHGKGGPGDVDPAEPDDADEPERFLTQPEIMDAVQGQLQTELDVTLPTKVPLNDGYRLTATTNSSATSAEIVFYQHTEPIPINNKLLFSDENPAEVVGRLLVEEYDTQKEADEAIAYVDFSESDGEEINLGYSTTGYQDGATGSLYTSWNVGRWALSVKGNTKHPEDSQSFAEITVKYLTKKALPIPKQNGFAHLDIDGNNTSIIWQKGKTVYTIDQTDDPMTALDMAVNFK